MFQEANSSTFSILHACWMCTVCLWECLVNRLDWISFRTCLMRCTKRPKVETKATENPVRPCVLCCSGLCAEVSGLKESKSFSTWPNMVCSRPRLDWSSLREATEDPCSSELLERHLLALVVRLLILPEKHIQRREKQSKYNSASPIWLLVFDFREMGPSWYYLRGWQAAQGSELVKPWLMVPPWLPLAGSVWTVHAQQPLWHLELQRGHTWW